MDTRVKQVLEYAIMAPSGDNCQPWRFHVDNLYVELFNDPQKDSSLYNLKQRASLIALGAALENMKIAAPSVGLNPKISLLPNTARKNHIASISFSECKPHQPSLLEEIPKRHTNREKYSQTEISQLQVDSWKKLVKSDSNTAYIATSRKEIKKLSSQISYNDRLVFEVEDLHRFLFEQIRWTQEEAESTKDGLDIETLGLNQLDKFAFGFLKNWKLVSILNQIGFSSIIQQKAKKTSRSSSAMAIIGIPGTDYENYIKGGMTWQRFLLQLSKEGLTAQPVAGLACLMQNNVEGLLNSKITDQQKNKLSQIREALFKLTEINNKSSILVIFRIGCGKKVTRSLRKPIESFFC